MRFDVIVIGAGAAGMMCAAQAGLRGRRVLLLDHAATVGERIRISGGGRCNFTNRNIGAENYLSQNPHFCRSALARFTQHDFIAMVERRRIPYHEREHGQLFCDDSALEIVDMLKDACDDAGVKWAQPCAVQRIARGEGGGFSLSTDQGGFRCDSLVIATGGLALPQIGANPFGYKVAEQFGLPVVPPRPALVPLALAPETLAPLKPLSGATLDAVTRCADFPAQFRENVLLTHRGLSGPATLQISSYWQMQDYQLRGGRKQPVEIDLLPGLDAYAWLAEHGRSKALLSNLLAERLPRRFAQEWCALFGWAKPLNELSKRELEAAAQALQGWVLMPSGTLGYAKAEVTLGGVDTNALSSKTMEAKAVPGLYFIGEVVDVTGWLGGYNFQWAWSSGWVAGQHA
jgi:predicted Rossmann fold flavoprotein